MSAPTRFNKIGLFGRKSKVNRGDYFVQTIAVPISAVASASAQSTGIFIPRGLPYLVTMDVHTPEVTGTTKTVSIGVAGGADDALYQDGACANAGFNLAFPAGAPPVDGDEVTFTLGSADFAELEATGLIFILFGTDT